MDTLTQNENSQQTASSPAFPSVVAYVTDWCSDSIRTMRFFALHDIPYTKINIDEDEEGEELVLRVNSGMRSVPTLLINGQYVTEPSNRQLREIFDIS